MAIHRSTPPTRSSPRRRSARCSISLTCCALGIAAESVAIQDGGPLAARPGVHPRGGSHAGADLGTLGRTQVVVRLNDGTSMRLPSAWADAGDDPPQHATDTIFTAKALRACSISLVDARRVL